jgi:hypothetical protein
MEYTLQQGEVLFCGNCEQQFTPDKVNSNFTCKYCGSRVTSWYINQTHEEALEMWENHNGSKLSFKDKIQQQHQFTSSFNTGGMANNHIERQIELLRDAKAMFIQHSQIMDNTLQLFNSGVRSLEQDELNHDYMDFLEEFLKEYSGKLKSMRETIDDEYLPAVERKIRYLEERE